LWPAMNSYLIERYLPGLSEAEIRAALERLEEACAELSAKGNPVRYVGSMFLPEEETCFCRLDGDSPRTAAKANELAKLPFARITAGLAITPTGSMPSG
ncbi:MAG: nickel-binding protein, partial [Solirubrobacteraceae bacterium]